MIEMENGETQQKSMIILEQTICEILFAMHKKRDPKQEQDKSLISRWCLTGTPELIYQSKDLYFIVPEEEEQKQADPEAQAENIKK